MQYSQEHLKTMVYAKFGGQTECIMGNWKIENWCPFEGTPIWWPLETRRNICSEFSYLCVNFIAWRTLQTNIYSETRDFYLKKSAAFFNQQKSFPGCQLNSASQKSLKIQASSDRKTKNSFEPKICLNKGV